MALVDYSDSEPDEPANPKTSTSTTLSPPAKKRKAPDATSTLPPLPQSFRDLYSSTVRTSTQDDPALHGGRKRVTPHVAGNWPSHVYLEWCPTPEESDALALLVGAQDHTSHGVINSTREPNGQSAVRSLLQNDLGVPLPLHISLSRPLALKTEQKDDFLRSLTEAIGTSGVKAFETSFEDLRWHPNEDHTRWFLVLRTADEDDEMLRLLSTCNDIAGDYKQPKLYENDDDAKHAGEKRSSTGKQPTKQVARKFHISIAWSLEGAHERETPSQDLPAQVRSIKVPFHEVKVRIGQDVTSLPLSQKRRKTSGVFS